MSSSEQSQSMHEKERSYGSIMMERVTGSKEGRVDHVLQVCVFPKTKTNQILTPSPDHSIHFWEKKLRLISDFSLLMQDKTFRHPYVSAIGAHT